MKTASGTISLSVIFVVLVAVFALGGYYFGNSQAKKEAAQKVTAQKPVLPVVLTNKAIKYAVANYTFSGKVLGVKNVAQGVELTTDIKATGVPKFVVTPKTKVYKINNGVQTESTLSAIASNQNIEISVPYGLKAKAWGGISFVKLGVASTNSSAKSGN